MGHGGWCLLLLGLLCAVGAGSRGRIHVLNTLRHHVDKRDAQDSRSSSASDGRRLSDHIALRVDLDSSQSVDLDLTLNDHVDKMVPIVVGQKGTVKPWCTNVPEEFGVYTDANSQATMFVRNVLKPDGTSFNEYMGIFKAGGTEFTVEPPNGFSPPSAHPGSGQGHRQKRSVDDATDYVIAPVNRSELVEEYDTAIKPCWFDGISNIPNNYSVNNRFPCYNPKLTRLPDERYRQELLQFERLGEFDSSSNQVYGVEILVVIDYAIFRSWYERSSEQTAEAKLNEAINSIRFYYSHILNGVDLRYSSINEPDFSVYVTLAGFYIATTPGDSPWTEGYTVREVDYTTGTVYTDAYRALDELESWLEIFQHELPFFDQATLFTGNVLFGGYSLDGSRRRISGLADIAGVCTYLRAAICREKGQYATTQTASHELGHSLGALHDGSHNSCDKSWQHVMAPGPGLLTDDNFYNPYSFSSCSVSEIRQQLRLMNTREMNCLTNTARHLNQTVVSIHLETPPGQIINVNQQCQTVFGIYSYYCGGDINDKRMCRELLCYDPFQGFCWRGYEQRAATGTTCGHRRWCERGSCVEHEDAPEAKDYCLNGDYLGRLGNGRYCRDVEQYPWMCYQPDYDDHCCLSCDVIKDLYNPACPYGDKYDWCDATSVTGCYDSTVEVDCCRTCAGVRRNLPDCEYGDRATWCPDVQQNRHHCYTSREDCCETCHHLSYGPSGCEYGDRASWCRNYQYTPWECYKLEIGRQCCDTCAGFVQQYGLPGCEYGDRAQYCSQYDCLDRGRWQDCCYTCRVEAGYSRVPTVPTTVTSTDPPTSRTFSTTTPATTSSTAMPQPAVYIPECVNSATWCKDLPASYCYTTDDICCERCTRFETGLPDCRYGDQFTWCANVTRRQCSVGNYRQDCCKKCEDKQATTPTTTVATTTPSTTTMATTPSTGCTDKATWCSTIPISYCYDVEITCCARCSPHRRNNKDCVYGDHYTWCKSQGLDKCQDPYIHTGCCEFCSESYTDYTVAVETTTASLPSSPGEIPIITECVADQFSFCEEEIKGPHCYLDEYRKGCCRTCEKFKTDVKDCEYGDLYSWCQDINVNWNCRNPQFYEPCCATCKQYSETSNEKEDDNPESKDLSVCEEDRASWCSTMAPSGCYVDDNICCSRCQDVFTGVGGCEYGDKVTWCEEYLGEDRSYCEEPDTLVSCCGSCIALGYNIPESVFELPEGILLELKSNLTEVLRKQGELLQAIYKYVNDFCHLNIETCCASLGKEKNVELRGSGYILKTQDVSIADGYPKKHTANTVLDKILVEIQPENVYQLCQTRDGANTEQHVQKRAITSVFLDSSLLQNIVQQYERDLELVTGLIILKIDIPDEVSSVGGDSFGIVGIVTVSCSFVLLILIIVVLVVKKVCGRKNKTRHVDPTALPPLQNSLPTVFHNNSFSRTGSLVQGLHTVSGSSYRDQHATPKVVQAWPETPKLTIHEKTVNLYASAADLNQLLRDNGTRSEELYSRSLPVLSEGLSDLKQCISEVPPAGTLTRIQEKTVSVYSGSSDGDAKTVKDLVWQSSVKKTREKDGKHGPKVAWKDLQSDEEKE